ncbi:MAG TPA: protoporphyrinogen oxidase [Candidatus Acidoferrales bacterium]|nr:protoporphyrinogen oxidase [Candidatus Acidoferrales bacterium]
MKVAVVGAGISGLSTAHFLRKGGADVVMLEKNNYPGGTIGSRVVDGYLVENGPNSTSETNLIIDELLNDLGIQDEKVYADENARYRFILRNGRLHALPSGIGSFITTKLWTVGGKVRLFGEPFVGRANHEESIADFVTRRLGAEFLDYAINPFVAGVYAGNPSELSVRAAFPKLYALEEKYGGLLKGTIKGAGERRRRSEKAKVSAKLFAFKSGMGILPTTIARKFEGAVCYNTSVVEAKSEGRKFIIRFSADGKTDSGNFDSVVLSTPSFAAAEIVKSWLPALSGELAKIKYPPVAVAVLGYGKEQVKTDLRGFGFLVPEIENRKILGTIWSSSIFPNRAPDGFVEFTTFVGGSRQPKVIRSSPEEIAKIAHEENSALMKIEGMPAFQSVSKWEKAIPQYNIGHLSIMDAVSHVESLHKGFYICSNYRDGISVADCIANGKKTAEAILAGVK